MSARSPIPQGFWGEIGRRIDWIKPYTKVKNTSFGPADVSIKWFEDGTLNVAPTASTGIWRRAAIRSPSSGKATIPTQDEQITYRQLHERVCKFANVLKAHGVKKGDRVTIYLPMIPEAAYAMLACARIGAIHSVVFGGFSPDSLAGRIEDADSKFIITADEGVRGGKYVPLKKNTDEALAKAGKGGEKVLVVRRTGRPVAVDRGPRSLAARGAGEGLGRLPAGGDERRRSAVHPLHVGLDRQAEGRAAHLGRLPGLRSRHASVRVRLPRRRHLLVHRRRRLGHGPQLHRLRAARQRRDDADVRGRAELPDHVALLERHRQVEASTSSTRRRRPFAR